MLYKTLFHIIAAAAGLLSVQTGEASGSCPVPSFQDSSVLEDFVEKVSVSAVSFNYEYVVDDGRARITGGGSIDMQGEAYLMNGDGLEVFCDGRTRWTVDRQSREVVVESYDPGQPDYTVNPAVLIQNFDKAFDIADSSVSSQGYACTLVPVSEDTGMAELAVRISPDGNSLVSADLKMSDGTVICFSVSSFSFSSPGDPGRFVFDVSALDSSYIVTDLR